MINISAKRVTRVLVLIALFLTLMSVAVEFAKIALGFGNMRGSVPLFSLINEDSLGTWFSSTALLSCSVLLMAIALAKKFARDRYSLHWGVLSVIFLYLSVDEGSMIHEKLGGIIGQLVLRATGIPQEGALARAWVVPGIVLVLVFALVYLRFFIALPPKIRRLFFVAGLLFVIGAAGIEMVSAFHLNFYGGAENMTLAQDTVRAQIPNAEEFLEMLGVIIFIYALMSYVRTQVKEVRFRISQ